MTVANRCASKGSLPKIALHQFDPDRRARCCNFARAILNISRLLSSATIRSARGANNSAIRPCSGPDIEQDRPRVTIRQCLGQRLLDRDVGTVQLAKLVPIGCVASEIRPGIVFSRTANGCKLFPVGLALHAELRILPHGNGKHPGNCGGKRIVLLVRRSGAQEHPTAFAAAFHESGVAQDRHVARNARLALVENLRQFADGQLHLFQQTQDTQSRRVGQSPEERFCQHLAIEI